MNHETWRLAFSDRFTETEFGAWVDKETPPRSFIWWSLVREERAKTDWTSQLWLVFDLLVSASGFSLTQFLLHRCFHQFQSIFIFVYSANRDLKRLLLHIIFNWLITGIFIYILFTVIRFKYGLNITIEVMFAIFNV